MCQRGSTECLLCVHAITPVRLNPPFKERRPCNLLSTIAEQLYFATKEDQLTAPPISRFDSLSKQAVL